MLLLEKTDVFGWESAIRGMRNPMNSWDKSDSSWEYPWLDIGKNDLDLMKKLSRAGTDHSKFLRMINVTVDVTAPLYWWKEYDTYKVGTVANSCSTMHKIHAKEFTIDDFSHEHLGVNPKYEECEYSGWNFEYFLLETIRGLNAARILYLKTNDKFYWNQMIQLLPSSYNQKRTIQLNYQVLKNIYFARRSHKLDEWHVFCDWIESLPYFREVCIDGNCGRDH